MDRYQDLLQEIETAKAGDSDRLPQLWETLSREFPDRTDGFIGAALHAQNMGDRDKAAQLWQRFRLAFPDQPTSYLFDAIFRRDNGDLAGAEQIMAEAVDRFPLLPLVGQEYAGLASRRGDDAAASTRMGAQYARLRQAADQCRDAGNRALHENLLQMIMQYFPGDEESGFEYVRLASGLDDLYQRWCKLPRGTSRVEYYQIAWQIAVAEIRSGRNQPLPLVYDALMSEPIGEGERAFPYFIREWIVKLAVDESLAQALLANFERHVADDHPLNTTGEMVVLALRLPHPSLNWQDLVYRYMIDEDFWRLCTLYKHHDNLADIPAAVQKLMDAGGLAQLTPKQIFNLTILVRCAKPEMQDYFVAEVLKLHPAPDSITEPLGVLAQAQKARRNLPTQVETPKRLRIALLIPGQMRTYQQTFPTWKALGLEDHDVDVFVHTWKVVGPKIPIIGHSHRVLRKHFSGTYERVFGQLGEAVMNERYPHFFQYFVNENNLVTEESLCRYFDTEHVVVQDDTDGKFNDMTLPYKIYYKVQSCFELVEQSGKQYDLIIRSRADLAMEGLAKLDWDNIYQRVKRERLILTGGGPDYLCPAMGHKIGDLFAIGDYECMSYYCKSLDSAHRVFAEGYYGCPTFMAGHVNFCYEMLRNGIRINDMCLLGLIRMSLQDFILEGDELRDLLRLDIGSGSRDVYDTMLLDAVTRDEDEAHPDSEPNCYQAAKVAVDETVSV